MKILKEDLDNLERVENRETVQGIMMKDAEEQSKKSQDNFKEVAGNPEDVKKKKPFLGAEKQETPKEVEIPKPGLEESLFEEAEKHTYYIKFKQNGKPYAVEFDAYNIEGAEQAFLRSFPDIKSRNEYEILSKDGGSLTHDYDENMNEDVNRVFQYSVDIIESSNQSSKHMEDKIVKVLEEAGIRVAGCMAFDTSWGMSEYGLSESKKIKESTKLHEAGGVKDGILYSTYGEPLTFWDKIYAELDGNLSNDNDYTKLIELPVKVKNKYQEISVTNDGNIRVFSPSEEGLQHALDVAEYYGLDYETGASTGYSDPAKAFYCTVIIPEERQEEFVTYDARKSRPVKKDNIKVA